MDAQLHQIELSTCTACGLCHDVCPNRIIQKGMDGRYFFRPDRVGLCFACGQCMAVCPSRSVQIPGLDYQRDFVSLPRCAAGEEQNFFDLIAARRSLRNFKDQAVPRELLEKIVAAVSFAPPGFPPIKTELLVVQDPALMRQVLPYMIETYATLLQAMRNPIARLVVRRKVGEKKFRTLSGHVVPLMTERLPELKSGAEDTITRRAPAMLVFHAHRQAENFMPDAYIALTYAFLAAEALGLGASAIDLIPPAIENNPRLRALLKIPAENEVVAAMIVGYPKFRYQRGIRRQLKAVTWL